MDSKEKFLDDITSAVESLTQKIERLQAKVDELCKSTGDCSQITAAHNNLLSKNESRPNGTNINSLRKKK